MYIFLLFVRQILQATALFWCLTNKLLKATIFLKSGFDVRTTPAGLHHDVLHVVFSEVGKLQIHDLGLVTSVPQTLVNSLLEMDEVVYHIPAVGRRSLHSSHERHFDHSLDKRSSTAHDGLGIDKVCLGKLAAHQVSCQCHVVVKAFERVQTFTIAATFLQLLHQCKVKHARFGCYLAAFRSRLFPPSRQLLQLFDISCFIFKFGKLLRGPNHFRQGLHVQLLFWFEQSQNFVVCCFHDVVVPILFG
mmetsp:Transcript_37892/g.55837  ORF Transcript_37892/g.55837 Transcript_37892/m.55837 type:complete len:247 (-) Transcript_37892:558-1298(-)